MIIFHGHPTIHHPKIWGRVVTPPNLSGLTPMGKNKQITLTTPELKIENVVMNVIHRAIACLRNFLDSNIDQHLKWNMAYTS